MFKQSLQLSIVLFLITSYAYAADRMWTTKETLPDGNKVVLYWTSVYEGRDTVYQIKVGDKLIHLGKMEAAGQPVLNLENKLIALPYCADDGCKSKVYILDLIKMKILKPIDLSFKGQFYITCKWVGTILEIHVDQTPGDNTNKSQNILKYDVTSKGVVPYLN